MLGECKRRILDNGLCVIGVENAALHYFVCNVMVHAGFRFETPRHAGLTHFLEHMLHRGCTSFPTSTDILRAVEDLGGALDAQTRPELLEVSLGVHCKHWRKGLGILTDLLRHPLFEEAAIEQERKIVAQEIAESRDDQQRNISPAEMAYMLLYHEEFSETGVHGGSELLQTFDRRLVQEQYDRFLVPENMVISLAGAFDSDQVLEELDRSLGRMPAGRPLPPLVQNPVACRRPRVVYRSTQRLPVVELEMACHAYGMGDERFPAAQAAAHILGGGLSSRLFAEVREKRGLVYHIDSLVEGYSDAGAVTTVLNVEAGSLLDALAATLEVIEKIVKNGVTADELERYKETVRCRMGIMCDRPQHLADWFGRQELLLRPERLLTQAAYVAQREALTEADLLDVLRDVLADRNRNLVVVGPFSPAQKDQLHELFPGEQAVEDEPARGDH